MVLKVFETLKFDCIFKLSIFKWLVNLGLVILPTLLFSDTSYIGSPGDCDEAACRSDCLSRECSKASDKMGTCNFDGCFCPGC